MREITDLEKEKQGIAIALTLPEDDESGIREKVFDELSLNDLKTENGLDRLLQFMDSKLKKEDLADSWEKCNNLKSIKEANNQLMSTLANSIKSTKRSSKKE